MSKKMNECIVAAGDEHIEDTQCPWDILPLYMCVSVA